MLEANKLRTAGQGSRAIVIQRVRKKMSASTLELKGNLVLGVGAKTVGALKTIRQAVEIRELTLQTSKFKATSKNKDEKLMLLESDLAKLKYLRTLDDDAARHHDQVLRENNQLRRQLQRCSAKPGSKQEDVVERFIK